jgi:hypothetical protein
MDGVRQGRILSRAQRLGNLLDTGALHGFLLRAVQLFGLRRSCRGLGRSGVR